jgi:receptor expression-enhancing protein 5/6
MGPLSAIIYVATYLLGLLYPAYVTVNAIESPGTQDDTQWLIYWLIFSLVQLLEAILWPVLKWLGGLYYLIKVVALAWLVLPQTKGATWLYEAVVSPTLKQLSTEARKVPALQKALDQLEAFTAGKPVTKTTAGKIE